MHEHSVQRPLLVEESEAAHILGLSRYRLRLERRGGKIAFKQIGGRFFYNLSVLESYANTTGGADEHPYDQQAGNVTMLRSTP